MVKLAAATFAANQALCKHLNGGFGQLDARQFPPVSLEMHADAAFVFRIAQTN
jgi:hypothetical protein